MSLESVVRYHALFEHYLFLEDPSDSLVEEMNREWGNLSEREKSEFRLRPAWRPELGGG